MGYCEAVGVITDPVNPYSPKSNVIAERMNRTLMNKFRALLFNVVLDISFWPYTLKVATYLINISPTKINTDFINPYEVFYGEKPNLKFLRVFGSIGQQHIPKEVRRQIVRRARKLKGELVNPRNSRICKNEEQKQIYDCIPTSFNQAVEGPFANQWSEAIQEELNSIEENHVWTPVDRDQKLKLIDTRWGFSLKKDISEDYKTKARMIVRRF